MNKVCPGRRNIFSAQMLCADRECTVKNDGGFSDCITAPGAIIFICDGLEAAPWLLYL
jgi:hypothetical protein